jgi:hypothetical protein
MKINLSLLVILISFPFTIWCQNIGINATGASPDPKAMLDIASTTSGLLVPRMTTAQRNAIATPPVGLYIYNLTTNSFDYFNGSSWVSLGATSFGNTVMVRSVSDFPAAASGVITLDAGKNYILNGTINIGANYINLNGASLQGNSPLTDVLISTASGGILRSVDKAVHIQQVTIAPGSAASQAFDFSDATGTHTCAILTGTSIRDLITPSLGIGQVSGFRNVIFLNSLWETRSGLKLTGNVGSLTFAYNIIHNITSGSSIELLSALVVSDVNISNNQFVYTGQVGVKLNAGASVDFGRFIGNNFRGVLTITSGFDSYTPGWEMSQNTGLPNSRSYAFAYMDGNTIATTFTAVGVYTKVLGATTLVTGQKFSASNNRFTYLGKRSITTRVFAVIGSKAPFNGADYSIAIAKNGSVLPAPSASLGSLTNNQGFQIVLETEVSLVTNDYLEVFIKTNTASTTLVVSDLQFRVSE